MSLATLEREIVAQARIALKNPRLRRRDLLEWCSGELKAEGEDEIVVYLEDPGCWAVFPRVCDRREV